MMEPLHAAVWRTKLTPLERDVAVAFLSGVPFSVIASRFRCTEKTVDNAFLRARRKATEVRDSKFRFIDLVDEEMS